VSIRRACAVLEVERSTYPYRSRRPEQAELTARIGGVGLQILRDWVLRFNARGPDGLLDGKAPGPRSRLNDAQRQGLVDIVEQGPIPAIHGMVRLRLIDLAQWLYDAFAVSLDETTISRELKKLGYVKLSAWVRRTRSRGVGLDAGPGPRHRKASGHNRHTSSARSAQSTARAAGSSCRFATPKPWRCTLPRYRSPSRRARTRSS
jgi:transposase